MKEVLCVINIISFILVMLAGLNGIVREILGAKKYEDLLSALKVPWSSGQLFKISYIFIAVFIITGLLREKFG